MSKETKQAQQPQSSLNDQMQRRYEERRCLMDSGVNPYPSHFDVTAYSSDIIEFFRDDKDDKEVPDTVAVAGRIMTIRKMGLPKIGRASCRERV